MLRSLAQRDSGPDEEGLGAGTEECPVVAPPPERPDTACRGCGSAALHTPRVAKTHIHYICMYQVTLIRPLKLIAVV